MRPLFRPRAATNLSHSTRQQLNNYAIAAGAAGVSLLALAPAAEAKIVYTATDQTISTTNAVQIDLNGDGKVEFDFAATFQATSFGEFSVGALFAVASWKPNQILGVAAQSRNWASALPAGALIGPTRTFVGSRADMAFGGYDRGATLGFCSGPWVNVKHHYLGLRFQIKGQYHYGWARLDEACLKDGENTAVLTGYAYETIPYEPIISGAINGPSEESGEESLTPGVSAASPISKSPTPASLGALALGVRPQ
jgi:hypothetical protein